MTNLMCPIRSTFCAEFRSRLALEQREGFDATSSSVTGTVDSNALLLDVIRGPLAEALTIVGEDGWRERCAGVSSDDAPGLVSELAEFATERAEAAWAAPSQNDDDEIVWRAVDGSVRAIGAGLESADAAAGARLAAHALGELVAAEWVRVAQEVRAAVEEKRAAFQSVASEAEPLHVDAARFNQRGEDIPQRLAVALSGAQLTIEAAGEDLRAEMSREYEAPAMAAEIIANVACKLLGAA